MENVCKQNMYTYIIYLYVIMIDYIEMNSYQKNRWCIPMLEKRASSPNHHH